MRTGIGGVVTLVLLGCASGGPGGGGEGVPVFGTQYDVPCEFEVVDTVRASYYITVGGAPTPGGSRGRAERALGRAGARAGADAVIVLESRNPSEAVRVPMGQTRQVSRTAEGEAVQYLDPTCNPNAPLEEAWVPGKCGNQSQYGVSPGLTQEEFEEVRQLLGALGSDGAELVTIGWDEIVLQNPDEIREVLRREYPPLLRDAGITGTVQIMMLVNEGGTVQSVNLSKTSGHRALDDTALETAMRAGFIPQSPAEPPICRWISLPFEFIRR